MSARSTTALLAALASTGPAGAKAADKLKLLANPRERYKAFLGEVKDREAKARPYVQGALSMLNAAEGRMESLLSSLSTTRASNLTGPDKLELERVSRWFGLRYNTRTGTDQSQDELLGRVEMLINWIVGMTSIIRSDRYKIILADDVYYTKRWSGPSGTSGKRGFTWYGPTNHDALDKDKRILFAFKGPAITLHSMANSDVISSTVAHEALHAYKGPKGSVHPFGQDGFEFDGQFFPKSSDNFDLIASDEKQWSAYLLDYSPYK